jgi:hypothetical protein
VVSVSTSRSRDGLDSRDLPKVSFRSCPGQLGQRLGLGLEGLVHIPIRFISDMGVSMPRS